jgi:hypothetical protein
MAELSERHEIRVRGKDHTIVFLADSGDGRLVIRQEPDGKKTKDVCTITISDPAELGAFFEGLRRILSSLGHNIPRSGNGRASPGERPLAAHREEDREATIAQARQRNPQAFAPWTREEEAEIRKRFQAGENPQAIARAHKRSPRAIELRLQRLGLMPQAEAEVHTR